MDVTQDYNQRYETYGGSRNTQQKYTAASKSLEYAKQGSNISSATRERVTAIPNRLNYKDTVGLFGVENVYIKLDLDVQNFSYEPVLRIENDYYDPTITSGDDPVFNDFYSAATSDVSSDVENDYLTGRISNDLSSYPNPMVSIDLKNLKTGNKYVDAHVDVRLYTKDYKEFPYDRMYIGLNEVAYLGFHARNTRRLPYNIECVIGEVYNDLANLSESERRYVATI